MTTHAFTTDGPAELLVELDRGTLVARTEDTDELRIDILGPNAEDFSVTCGDGARGRGEVVAVRAPQRRAGFASLTGSGGSHEVVVVAPTGSLLVTRTGSADTRVLGSWGALRLKSGSGDVVVERTDAPSSVDTGSGDLRVDHAGDELRIRSGSGDVEIGELGGATSVSTGSGDVRVIDHQGEVEVKTGSGELRVDRSVGDLSLQTGSGDLRVLQAVRGNVSARTSSGDVVVGIPHGTPVWTDIGSTSGSVRSDITGSGAPAEGQEHVTLRLSTSSGDISLLPSQEHASS